MPGVVVSTNVQVGSSGVGQNITAQWFAAGTTQRGPTDEPKLCRSVADFTSLYGGYESGNLYSSVRTFFEEGGERVYVYRVVGAGASAGQLILADTNPSNVLQLDAANVGDWSDNLDAEVVAGDSGGTFKIKIYLDDVVQYVTRDLVDAADAEAVLNAGPTAHLLVATSLDDSAVCDTAAKTAFSGGGDGSAPQTADFTGALDNFNFDLGVGAVSLPGQTGSSVWTALLAHAEANNRIALCAFGENDSASTAKTAVASYYSAANAHYGAFYFPWVKVPSPTTLGLQINVSPEAWAAAARAKAVMDNGPWRAGAGIISNSRFVNGVNTILTKADADVLDEKRINAIRKIGNSYRVYGARSVSSDEDNWRFITLRDTLNYIVQQCESRLEQFLFSPIDSRGSLFTRIEASLVGLLDPIRLDGGLYEAYDTEGVLVDPGYSVQVSDDNNPASQLIQGKVSAKVGVRISSVGDLIEIMITKANLQASVM